MDDDPAGPAPAGPHHKPLSKTLSLKVLSEMDDGSDDEPPGRSRLEQALIFKSSSASRARHNGRGNGRAHGANGHAHNGHTNGDALVNGKGGGVALLEPPRIESNSSD